jgi:predicted nuclease with TOPRIM domain
MHMETTLGSPFTPHSQLGSAEHPCAADVEIQQNEANQLQGRIASIMGENQELRAQVEQLRAEKSRMADILSRLVEVLGSKSPDKLVHDVRNVLNERDLYRALADSAM